MIDYSKMITAEDKFNQAKEAKMREIDSLRDQALEGGFEFKGQIFDSDAKSIQRISAIATLSLLNPNFSTPYITHSNQTVILTAEDIKGLGEAAAAHEANLIFQARDLKDQVLAATTQEELDAINWE